MNNGLKVKGIFLDLDGTIVDSTQAYTQAAKTAFQTLGQKTPDKKILLEIPRRVEQGLPISDIVQVDVKQFLSIYLKAYYALTPKKTTLIPNVAEALEVLSRKSKLALITMRHVPKQDIITELECFGISKYFTHIVTALDTSKPKPSPESLIKCVQAMDVDICACIIAGDSVNDVRAGKAAGAGTVAVLSGLYRCEELQKERPDLIIKDLTELPNFID